MFRQALVSIVLIMAGIPLASIAAEHASSPKEVMAHHIKVVKQDDVDAIMQDYASNAVVVLTNASVTQAFIGAAEIRKYFAQEASQHYDWKSYVVTQEVKADGVVFQKEVKTGDTEVFVIRNGKIVFQTMRD